MRHLCCVILAAGFMALSGCVAQEKRVQLEHVAKDWCLVVRASQVIPVYPLTEDVQPGDVFLVQTPIPQQVDEYERRGFLPLEQMIARLQPHEYPHFYLKSHGIGDLENTPHHWKFPAAGQETDWPSAPGAGFPSYGFSVDVGSGLSLALPVKGIPVALSILGAESAHCSLTIGQAHTYGVDGLSMERQVRQWARDNRDFLRMFPPVRERGFLRTTTRPYYLRVINRVYLAQTVNASVMADKLFGAGAAAGAPKTVPLPQAQPGQSAEQYKQLVEAVNQAINESMGVQQLAPGGAFKLVVTSGRTISMQETFPRPLVIGYIGFDMPIDEQGRLGRRISTRELLTGAPTTEARFAGDLAGERRAVAMSILGSIYHDIARTAKAQPGGQEERLLAELDELGGEVPDTLDFTRYASDSDEELHIAPPPVRTAAGTNGGFARVIGYWSHLHGSVDNLELFAARRPQTFTFNGATADEGIIDTLRRDSQRQRKRLEAFEARIGKSPAVADAVDYYTNLLKGN